MSVELYIGNIDGTKVYQPAVQEGIEWSTERSGTPGKITFKVMKDDILDFTEGSPVRLTEGNDKIFLGYVFKQQYSKDKIITVTAYDQLRYMKNKDTWIYENKTASQVIKLLADSYSLSTGTLEDSNFIIPSRIETDVSLFEIIANALDLTLNNTGKMYVLYDDFGKLTLKSLMSMCVGDEINGYLCIDEETGQNYDYSSSIDDNTYNKIVLKNDSTKKDFIVAHDVENINKWGVLTYTGDYKDGENGQAKADALLSLYNKKTRTLKINKAIGDSRVRAGSMVVVDLDLGDVKVKNFMLVEKCKHTYKENEHWMDLTLRGGEFVG